VKPGFRKRKSRTRTRNPASNNGDTLSTINSAAIEEEQKKKKNERKNKPRNFDQWTSSRSSP
jgi:hypothetical protein